MTDIDKIPGLDKIDNLIFAEDKVVSISDAIKSQKTNIKYIPLGFSIFDDCMGGGVAEGDLITISAKPGEGKTSFCQTLTYNFNQQEVPCLWLSYEVSLVHLWEKFKNMGLDKDLIAYTPLKMTTGKIDWVEAKIDEAILKFKTKVIFIDHLGFLLPRTDYSDNISKNYSLYLGTILRQLKRLAVDKEIIIFLCAHVLKKEGEINLTDIAHSASMAQESDFVFMLERQKNKHQFSETGDTYTEKTKLKLSKNRRGGKLKYTNIVMIKDRFHEVGSAEKQVVNINFDKD